MTSAAPAHALLSAAHSLLKAAMHHGRDQPAAGSDSKTISKTHETISTEKLNTVVVRDPIVKDIPVNAIIDDVLDSNVLPIDEVKLPEDDVADLHDVVDAINKLCDTMKTSSYEVEEEEASEYEWEQVGSGYATSIRTEINEAWTEQAECSSASNEMYNITEEWNNEHDMPERVDEWARSQTIWTNKSPTNDPYTTETDIYTEYEDNVAIPDIEEIDIVLPGQIEDTEQVTSDGEPVLQWEAPTSEMYYTASSEVSLVSDMEIPDRAVNEMEDSVFASDIHLLSGDLEVKEEKSECVVAGHVAAMRERFESMTRSTTPCPEYLPALDQSRNITPLPDHS